MLFQMNFNSEQTISSITRTIQIGFTDGDVTLSIGGAAAIRLGLEK